MSSTSPPSDRPYQKVVWREKGQKVSRIVPVTWVHESESGAFTFVAWPNKVNVERDIVNRTKPTKEWQFFPVHKRKQFFASWEEEDSSEYTTTDSEPQTQELARSQRKRKAADNNHDDEIAALRRRLSKVARKESTLPPLPPAFKKRDGQPMKRNVQVDRITRVFEEPKPGPSMTQVDKPKDNTEVNCIPESEPELEDEPQLSGLIEFRDADVSSSETEDNPKVPLKKKKKSMSSTGNLTPVSKGKSTLNIGTPQKNSAKHSPCTPVNTRVHQTGNRPIKRTPQHQQRPKSTQLTPKGRPFDDLPQLAHADLSNRHLMDPAALQWNIYRKLDLILEELADLKKDRSGPTVAKALEILPRPMCTKREVDALEELVSNNPDHRAALLQLFAQTGSASPAQMTRNILNRLLDPSAAQSFNVRGTGKKISFKTYQLCDIVHEAVKIAYPRRNTDKDVNQAMVNSLRSAGTRLKRRANNATNTREQLRQAQLRAEEKDNEIEELGQDNSDQDDYSDEENNDEYNDDSN